MNPSVVITGGSGFLGRQLASTLRNQFPLLVVDIGEPTRPEVNFLQCDVSRFESVSDLFEKTKPQTIVHLAAVTGVERCKQKPAESFLVNVTGTLNVAWMSAVSGTRMIFASSREVYGETLGGQSDENTELRPNNLYGLTKLLGESAMRWLGTAMGLRYTILRFTNFYGPGGDQYAVAAIIKKAIRGEEIPVFGGDQVLNLIHVRDAARAIEICLEKDRPENETFNIGSRDTIRVADLINRIVRVTNSNSKAVTSQIRIGETMFFKPSLEKAHYELGFESTIDLDRGLKDLVKYYRAEGTAA